MITSKMELKNGCFKISDIQTLKNVPVVSNSYYEQAMEWWENLTDEEIIKVFIKTGNFRLGGWCHDIGPTEEDVVDMYKNVFNCQ